MPSIKLTAKRQATLPKELCDELHVEPGDRLRVERHVVAGETVWVLRPETMDWSWIGAVPVPANASHDMDEIRESVRTRRPRDK